LLVGSSFAKAMALALNIPLIEVDHLQGHVLSVFLEKDETKKEKPQFPFLCLTVSGGHTLLLKVHDYFDMQVVGKTIDDAAGEAFDKAAKILGLPYPGGPVIDKLASAGNPLKFQFSTANLPNFDFSFSGLKTSFLYFVRDQLKNDKQFIEKNLADLAASIQFAIIQSLTKKMKLLLEQDKCKDIVLAGGVSANSGLRVAMKNLAKEYQRNIFLPDLDLTTDNAAMIAISGYFKYLKQEYSSFKVTPYSSSKI
jgi:N6-L-threonylcarbamoyladenine synthase